jgi:hypothetical protein
MVCDLGVANQPATHDVYGTRNIFHVRTSEAVALQNHIEEFSPFRTENSTLYHHKNQLVGTVKETIAVFSVKCKVS